jgi:hypothetical protein
MKKIIWKWYVNYEKEERWLNEMAAKGLALVRYTWCRYVFEDCKPGEYIYRIELLAHSPRHAESRKYIEFLAGMGIEHIDSYWRWIYFRKKAELGAFDLYSDIDSRMKHYRRVNLFISAVAFLNLFAFILNLVVAISDKSVINYFAGGVSFTVCLILFFAGRPSKRKRKELKEAKKIREP